MAESATGEMVELHFDDELVSSSGCHSIECLVLQRLSPPGALPVKPGGLIIFSSFFVSAARSSALNRRGEADVIEHAFGVVEAEQQRAHQLLFFEIAEAAHHAIGGALRS